MRLRRSIGETISSRFCFSSTPTSRCAAMVSASLRRIVDAHGGDHRVEVQVVRELHVLLEHRDHAAHHRLDVGRRLLRPRDDLHHHAVEALVFLPLDRARAIDAFDEHLDVAVGQLQALHDVGDAPHRVDVVRLRFVDRGVVLRGEEDPLVLRQRLLQRADGRRPPDDERHHHVREDDDVPQGNDREGFVDFHRCECGYWLQADRPAGRVSRKPGRGRFANRLRSPWPTPSPPFP